MKENKQNEKVTIYYQGVLGMSAVEGRLVRHGCTSGGGVSIRYVRKGCRRMSGMSSIYASHFLIVKGWKQPAPETPWVPAEAATPGVTLSRGRYMSCDPRWGSDFDKMIDQHDVEIVADYRSYDRR